MNEKNKVELTGHTRYFKVTDEEGIAFTVAEFRIGGTSVLKALGETANHRQEFLQPKKERELIKMVEIFLREEKEIVKDV